MKIRAGDWVTWPGYVTEANPKGVHRVSADDMANAEPDAWQQTKPLYVPDAFELAGVPVPESAKIVSVVHSHEAKELKQITTWPRQWLHVAENKTYLFNDGWGISTDLLLGVLCYMGIDISRLPIADAWECLPLFVREKLEQLVQP